MTSSAGPAGRLDSALLDALDSARGAVSSTEDLSKHFASTIEWLDTHRAIWTSRSWRIGLIGITSSGKSTLLNALMNDRLLPARVRPSSNTLVVCFRGDSTSAVVHFNDGHEESVHDGLAEALSRLADEATNPGNRLGVKEIELSSPGFALGEGIELVDTPGLDARGYDEHERLTLKTLLPTVDLAIFLTTAKANSDALVRSYLDVIAEAGKPSLVVQNMIDSVEPKLGRLGVEEKSRGVVAEECRQRLHRLLQRCSSPLARRANVVQVSAQWALLGRRDDSQLSVLVDAVKAELERLAPQLAEGRRAQLARHIEEVVRSERDGLKGAVISTRRSPDQELDGWAERLDDVERRLTRSLTVARKKARDEGEAFVRSANELSERGLAAAEQLKKQLEEWTREVPKKLSTILDDATSSLRAVASELNLSAEDIELPMPRGAPRRALSVETGVRTEYVSQPKRGMWASIKRFFGSESYEDVPTEVPILKSVDSLRDDVTGLVRSEQEWLEAATGTIASTAAKQAKRVRQELDRRRREFETQRASQLQAEQRIRTADALALIVASLKKGASAGTVPIPAPSASQVWADEKYRERVPAGVGSILQLAAVAARSRHGAARRVCIARAERKRPAPRRALIWGWDLGYVTRFIELYWRDVGSHPSPRAGALTRWDGVPPVTELGIAVEEDGAPSAGLAADLDSFLAKPTILFLLLDPHQVGSTDSQLTPTRSVLPAYVKRVAHSVIVAQTVRSLLHSTEALAEGVIELKRISRGCGLTPLAFLANDDSSSLSALLDTLWFAKDIRTQHDEQQILSALKARWFDPPVDAASLIRDWRLQTRRGTSHA